MRRLLLLLTIIIFTSSIVFSQTEGAKRYVAMKTVSVKESTGFFARDLGTLSLGDEVTMILEDGKWTQVRSGNLTGWVLSNELSTRRILSSGTGASVSEIALAGKGFSQELEMEYRKNGLDYSIVDSIERITIPQNELLTFITEGRLTRGGK